MIYKMYAVVSNSDNISQIDIQTDGILYGLSWIYVPAGMDALNDLGQIELSFMSTNTFTTNDVRGSISQIGAAQQFLTSGGGAVGVNASISDLRVQLNGGERLFLHASASSGVGGAVSCYLYVDDGIGIGGARPQPRRR